MLKFTISLHLCGGGVKNNGPESDIMVKNKLYISSLIFISTTTTMAALSFYTFYKKNCLGPYFLNLPCGVSKTLQVRM